MKECIFFLQILFFCLLNQVFVMFSFLKLQCSCWIRFDANIILNLAQVCLHGIRALWLVKLDFQKQKERINTAVVKTQMNFSFRPVWVWFVQINDSIYCHQILTQMLPQILHCFCCLAFIRVTVRHRQEGRREIWGRCHAARCRTKGCYMWLWSASCGGGFQSTDRHVPAFKQKMK